MDDIQYQYKLTLVSLRIKHRPNHQLTVTNRRYSINLIPVLVDDVYLFNQSFVFSEARKHKQHIELLINLISEKGNVYIGGAIVLNRFEIQPSNDVLNIKLANCLDQSAFCQLIVDNIQPLASTTRKRGDSLVVPCQNPVGWGFSGNRSMLCPSPSSASSKVGWFPANKSTKSVTPRSNIEQDLQGQVNRQLVQYKLLLDLERQKVKKLEERVKELEQQTEGQRQQKLRLRYCQQEWFAEKQALTVALRRSQSQNLRCQNTYLQQIQTLRKMIFSLQQSSRQQEYRPLGINTQQLIPFGFSSLARRDKMRGQLAWKKKKPSIDDFQRMEPSESTLSSTSSLGARKNSNSQDRMTSS